MRRARRQLDSLWWIGGTLENDTRARRSEAPARKMGHFVGYLQNAREEVKNERIPCAETASTTTKTRTRAIPREASSRSRHTRGICSLSSGCHTSGTRPRDFSSRYGNSVQRFSIKMEQGSCVTGGEGNKSPRVWCLATILCSRLSVIYHTPLKSTFPLFDFCPCRGEQDRSFVTDSISNNEWTTKQIK